MKLFIICVCIVAVQCGKKPKKDKAVKQLKGLCSAYNSSYVTVQDSTFDDIFSDDMLGSFCDGFFAALNESAKPVFNYVDGIKALSKACKSYGKKHSEAPSEGPLVGFEAICNATEEARARSLNDKFSRKALAGLRDICVAQDAGNLIIKVANFSQVFADLEGFCDAYMNDTEIAIMTKRRGDSVDGVRVLDKVCRWYSKKFENFTPEGSLAQLEPICEDFDEIKMALEEEEEDEEGEDEEDTD